MSRPNHPTERNTTVTDETPNTDEPCDLDDCHCQCIPGIPLHPCGCHCPKEA